MYLQEEPRRFGDLEGLIDNKRTRSRVLGLLKKYGLVEKVLVEEDRTYIYYKATAKAGKFLGELKKLVRFLENQG